jgi:hypothetical protein
MTGKTVSRAEDKRRVKNCGILLQASAMLHMLDEAELANELEVLAVKVRNGDRTPDPSRFFDTDDEETR